MGTLAPLTLCQPEPYIYGSSATVPLHGERRSSLTVAVAQLVRALDCGSKSRGFESPQPPFLKHVIRKEL